MPVRPELRALYPADWPAISRRIRFDVAGGRCQRCNRPHLARVLCLPDGRWEDFDARRWYDGNGAVVAAPSVLEVDRSGHVTKVVLTCAHIEHDPSRNDDADLAAWCGRCHLLHDAPHHRAQRRLTYRLRSAIGDLFAGLYSLAGYPRNGGQS